MKPLQLSTDIPFYLFILFFLAAIFVFSPAIVCAQEKYPALRLPIGHTKDILAMDISSDGKLIATSGKDRLIIIWDAKTGKVINWFPTNNESFKILFTPGNGYLLAAEANALGVNGSALNLWDVKTGRKIKTYSFRSDNNIAVAPTGSLIMACPFLQEPDESNDEDNKVNAHLYNIFNESDTQQMRIGFNMDPTSMTLANPVFNFMQYENGLFIISTKTNFRSRQDGDRYAIDIWDTKDVSHPAKTIPHKEQITAIATTRAGGQFATITGTKITLWNMKTGKMTTNFIAAGNEIIEVVFSNDASSLFCYSTINSKKIMQVWSLKDYKEILNKSLTLTPAGRSRFAKEDPDNHCIFSPDGRHIAISNGKEAKMFDVNGNAEYDLKGTVLNVRSLFFASNDRFLMSSSDNKADREAHYDLIVKALGGSGKEMDDEDKQDLKKFKEKEMPAMKEYINNSISVSLWDLNTGKNFWQNIDASHSVIVNSKTISQRTDTLSLDKNFIIMNQENKRSAGLFDLLNKWRDDNENEPKVNGAEGILQLLSPHDDDDEKQGADKGEDQGILNSLPAMMSIAKKRFGESTKEKLLVNRKLHDTLKLITIDTLNWIIINKDGYYKCSKDAAGLLHYVSADGKIISFEQLDLLFNRPDIILRSLGSTNQKLIEALTKTYETRLQRYKFTAKPRDDFDIPEAGFLKTENIEYNQNKRELSLSVHAGAQESPLSNFNIWVNEVPVFGKNGLAISNSPIKNFDTTITVQLSEGNNKIETSVVNVKGFESYRFPLYLNYTPPVAAKKKTWFIGIAVNKYADVRNNRLKFTINDIRALATELKKKSKEEFSIDTLFNAAFSRENLALIKLKLQSAGVDDKIIIAYSGHGDTQDGVYYLPTSNMNAADFKKPAGKSISYEEIERLFDNTPARNRLLLLDACHSGILDGQSVNNPDINNSSDSKTVMTSQIMEDIFTYIGRETGATILASSSGTEESFEPAGTEVKHGFFTQSILNAIATIPSIKVLELKKYVIEQVPILTNKEQQPGIRSENRQANFVLW